jgi:hypothetical protein
MPYHQSRSGDKRENAGGIFRHGAKLMISIDENKIEITFFELRQRKIALQKPYAPGKRSMDMPITLRNVHACNFRIRRGV